MPPKGDEVLKSCYRGYRTRYYNGGRSLKVNRSTEVEEVEGTELDDGCTSDWEFLPNSSKRQISNVAGSGETFVSDASIVDGWYTVATGYTLANTDGTYPKRKLEKVAVRACTKTYFNSCDHLFDLTIQCCGSYFVYYLKNTTVSSAYCLVFAKLCLGEIITPVLPRLCVGEITTLVFIGDSLGTARSCNNDSSCSIVSGTTTGTNCRNGKVVT
ncbi:hypothetical protein CHS0354_031688 [Potamilus streckersoni]|uniref:Uncharacterized protein n=1 Tax=Potamilus streckersoni TaxID=2493646 RepID=A0AAE0W0S7_9BIVA|nr:hypothetical protein CHS0354_031688 [Potamilus streckersoni]